MRIRRAGVVPRLRLAAACAALLAVSVGMVAGCGAGGRVQQESLEADPAFVLRVLPTRPGLDIAGPERSPGPGGIDRAALDESIPDLVASARDAGLRTLSVREWTGPDGARLVAVAGLWDDGDAAGAIGGEIARKVVPDGSAWTPVEYGASRGYRSEDARALSVVIGRVWLFVRAEGPVDDDAVLRTVELMRKAAAQQDERGSAPDE